MRMMIFLFYLSLINCAENTKNLTNKVYNNNIPDVSIAHTLRNPTTTEDSINVFLDEWKRDSIGCLRLRTNIKAAFLIDKLALDKRSAKEILNLLGPPNYDGKVESKTTDKYYFEPFIMYKYIFDSICYNGLLCDSCDICWIEFKFNIKDSMVIRIEPAVCI